MGPGGTHSLAGEGVPDEGTDTLVLYMYTTIPLRCHARKDVCLLLGSGVFDVPVAVFSPERKGSEECIQRSHV